MTIVAGSSPQRPRRPRPEGVRRVKYAPTPVSERSPVNPHPRLSMRDVAEMARVSIGTVSNVINNPERVLPATRERVEEAIRHLGWAPNQQAQALRAGKSRVIGLAVMDVANPFFADVLRGAQGRLEDAGYAATIGDSDNRPEREASALRSFRDQRVRGVILGPIGATPPEVDSLLQARIPTVLVDRAHGGSGCTVGVDDVAGGRIAAEHLIEQGHSALAFVGGPSTLAQVRDRREGAEQAAAAAGVSILAISVNALDFASGRAAAEQLALLSAAERPTGIFCANDMIAIGLLQGLVAARIRVPHDVAIVGYDDIDFAAAAAVPLSSVAQPRRELGSSAADLLLRELEDQDHGHAHEHRTITYTPTLIARASSVS